MQEKKSEKSEDYTKYFLRFHSIFADDIIFIHIANFLHI